MDVETPHTPYPPLCGAEGVKWAHHRSKVNGRGIKKKEEEVLRVRNSGKTRICEVIEGERV